METGTYVCIAAVAVVTAVAMIVTGFLAVRCINAVKSLGGASYRATERERHAQFNLIVRLMEKRDGPAYETAVLHARERMAESAQQHRVEETEIKAASPSPPEEPDQFIAAHEAVPHQ